MPRTCNLLRRTCRSPTTRAWRTRNRSTLRSLSGCRRRPNDLSQALTAFRLAIRCHHRLAKLAPSFFDSAGGKGVRQLGIPTVVDRLVQPALLQVLEPIYEPTFSEGSYGFRPGRGAHDALRQASQ